MNTRTLSLIAAFIATFVYGISFTIAKEVMPMYVKPFGFILLRVAGATLIFWGISLFIKARTIENKDYITIFMAAIFGVALNMLSFFKGLNYTTPISASAMMLTTPILVLIFASILLKERLVIRKIVGILIGLVGAFFLITYGSNPNVDAKDEVLGNFLVFVNAASYSVYIIIAKKLLQKYHPIIFVKWLYLFGFILVLPFGFDEFRIIQWETIPTNIYFRIGFVIVFTTCVTYLCNLFALSKLKPTTVSIFVYLQPVIATIYALIAGSDSLNYVKILSTILIFFGVYLVTKQVKTTSNNIS